jgi:hypothetical protein
MALTRVGFLAWRGGAAPSTCVPFLPRCLEESQRGDPARFHCPADQACIGELGLNQVDGAAPRAVRQPTPKAQFFSMALTRVGFGMARGAAPSTNAPAGLGSQATFVTHFTQAGGGISRLGSILYPNICLSSSPER